jgi:hypothetical protein
MEALHRFGDAEDKSKWRGRSWMYSPDLSRDEAYWGSRLLMDASEVQPAEALRRIDPALVMELGEAREWGSSATDTVATYIYGWLTAAEERIRHGAVVTLPAAKIVSEAPMERAGARPSAISSVEPDRSIRFISPSVIWGGMYASGETTVEPFKEESSSEWQMGSALSRTLWM